MENLQLFSMQSNSFLSPALGLIGGWWECKAALIIDVCCRARSLSRMKPLVPLIINKAEYVGCLWWSEMNSPFTRLSTRSHDTWGFLFSCFLCFYLFLWWGRSACRQMFACVFTDSRCSQDENAKQAWLLMCFVREVLHPKVNVCPINHQHWGGWIKSTSYVDVNIFMTLLMEICVLCFCLEGVLQQSHTFSSLCWREDLSLKGRSEANAACLLKTNKTA